MQAPPNIWQAELRAAAAADFAAAMGSERGVLADPPGPDGAVTAFDVGGGGGGGGGVTGVTEDDEEDGGWDDDWEPEP
jgi:hypothetical protein